MAPLDDPVLAEELGALAGDLCDLVHRYGGVEVAGEPV